MLKMVSFGEQLVLLVESFVAGFSAAVWVIMLFLLVMYVYAVLGKELFYDDALRECLANGPFGTDLDMYFGSIPRTFVTLMQLFVTDGNIDLISRPIGECWPASWIYFLSFFIIASVAFMEMMTAVYIDALVAQKEIMETNNQTAGTAEEGEHLREELKKLCTGIFKSFDEDGNDYLSDEELPAVIEFTQSQQIHDLLDLLHVDRNILTNAFRIASETAKMAKQAEGADATQLLAALAICSDAEKLKHHELQRSLCEKIDEQSNKAELKEIRQTLDVVVTSLGKLHAMIARQENDAVKQHMQSKQIAAEEASITASSWGGYGTPADMIPVCMGGGSSPSRNGTALFGDDAGALRACVDVDANCSPVSQLHDYKPLHSNQLLWCNLTQSAFKETLREHCLCKFKQLLDGQTCALRLQAGAAVHHDTNHDKRCDAAGR